MKTPALLAVIVGLIAAYIFFVPALNFHIRSASNAKLARLTSAAQQGDISALKQLARQVKGRNGANAVVELTKATASFNNEAVAKYVIPAFVKGLTSRNGATRRQAALSSESLVRNYPLKLIPALSHMATNEDPAQAHLAIETIAQANEHSAHSLLVIARHYQASTFMPGGGFDYRAPKAVAFKELSTAASSLAEAQALFRSGLQDPNPHVQLWSAVGLFKSGSRELAEAKFVEFLNSGDEDFLFHAKAALRELPSLSANLRAKGFQTMNSRLLRDTLTGDVSKK